MNETPPPQADYYILLHTPDSEREGRALNIRHLSIKPEPGRPVSLKVTTDKLQNLSDPERQGFVASIELAASLSWMLSRNHSPELPKAYTLYIEDSDSYIIDGRSAGLSLVLATVANLCPQAFEQEIRLVAATGIIQNGHGKVEAVSGLEHKLRAYCELIQDKGLAQHAVLFLPADNKADWDGLPAELTRSLSALKIVWVDNVCEALEALAPGRFPDSKSLVETPFKGLQSFDYDDRWSYYGRERECEYVYSEYLKHEEQVRRGGTKKRIIFVRGSSGSGKSSFAKAGLLPMFCQLGASRQYDIDYLWAVFRPSDSEPSAILSLAYALFNVRGSWSGEWKEALHEKFQSPENLAAQLLQNHAAVMSALTSILDNSKQSRAAAPGLILVADQFEEVFRQSGMAESSSLDGDGELILFYEILLKLSVLKDPVYFIITLREDYAHEVSYLPLKRCMMVNGEGVLVELGQVDPAGIKQIVNKPFASIGYQYEQLDDQRSLSDVIEYDANKLNDTDNVLPFLELLLSQLFDSADRGVIHNSSYQQGDLSNIICSQANQALQNLDEQIRARLSDLFSILIGYREHDNKLFVTSVALTDIEHDQELMQLVATLEKNRILVRVLDKQGELQIRFVHDAVLQEWDAITDWLEQDNALESLRNKYNAEQACLTWKRNQESNAYLLRGGNLRMAKAMQKKLVLLNSELKDYVNKSSRRSTIVKYSINFVIVVLVSLAAISTYIHLDSFAQYRYRLAGEHFSKSLLTYNRYPEQSLYHIVKSLQSNQSPEVIDAFWDIVNRPLPSETFKSTLAADYPIDMAAYAGKSKEYIASGKDHNKLIIFNALDFTKQRMVTLKSDTKYFGDNIVVSTDGAFVARYTLGKSKTVYVARTTHPQAIVKKFKHNSAVNYLTISPDGKKLFSATASNELFVWDIETGNLETRKNFDRMAFNNERIQVISFVKNDNLVYVGTNRGRIYRLSQDSLYTPILVFQKHRSGIIALKFSNDGRRVLSASLRQVYIWDLSTGKVIKRWQERSNFLFRVDATADLNVILMSAVGSITGGSRHHVWRLSDDLKYQFTLQRVYTKQKSFFIGAKEKSIVYIGSKSYRWKIVDPAMQITNKTLNCFGKPLLNIKDSTNSKYIVATTIHADNKRKGDLCVWSRSSKKLLWSKKNISTYDHRINYITDDGKKIISLPYGRDKQNRIKVTYVGAKANAPSTIRLSKHKQITAVGTTPDNKSIYLGDDSGGIYRVDLTSFAITKFESPTSEEGKVASIVELGNNKLAVYYQDSRVSQLKIAKNGKLTLLKSFKLDPAKYKKPLFRKYNIISYYAEQYYLFDLRKWEEVAIRKSKIVSEQTVARVCIPYQMYGDKIAFGCQSKQKNTDKWFIFIWNKKTNFAIARYRYIRLPKFVSLGAGSEFIYADARRIYVLPINYKDLLSAIQSGKIESPYRAMNADSRKQ